MNHSGRTRGYACPNLATARSVTVAVGDSSPWRRSWSSATGCGLMSTERFSASCAAPDWSARRPRLPSAWPLSRSSAGSGMARPSRRRHPRSGRSGPTVAGRGGRKTWRIPTTVNRPSAGRIERRDCAPKHRRPKANKSAEESHGRHRFLDPRGRAATVGTGSARAGGTAGHLGSVRVPRCCA
jgi:hypothetical protein